MPTYEYVCKSCGHLFEIVQPMRDDPLTECPECGGLLRKVFAPPAISFKGSGFYATDKRKKTPVAAGDKGSGDKSSGDKGSGDKGAAEKSGASGDGSGEKKSSKTDAPAASSKETSSSSSSGSSSSREGGGS